MLRRGVPVAHKVFGVPTTINCANYVMFQALERVLLMGNPRAVQVSKYLHDKLEPPYTLKSFHNLG